MKLSFIIKGIVFALCLFTVTCFANTHFVQHKPLIQQTYSWGGCVIPPFQILGLPPCLYDLGDVISWDNAKLIGEIAKLGAEDAISVLNKIPKDKACIVLVEMANQGSGNITPGQITSLMKDKGCGALSGGGGGNTTHDDAWCQAQYNTPESCNSSNNQCFWYAGFYGLNEHPKCVSQAQTKWGSSCDNGTNTWGGRGCYEGQTCDNATGTCYSNGSPPPNNSSPSPLPKDPSTAIGCFSIKEVDSCNSTTSCFWALADNGKGYCELGAKGPSCGAQIYCRQGQTCNVTANKCDSHGCDGITDVNSCNISAGCFWHLSNTIANKGECVTNPRGASTGAQIYCRPNETPDIKKGLCIPNGTSGRNTCMLDDNGDNAFKCMSACSAPWGTTAPGNGSGYFSCGSAGGTCCRDDATYAKRQKLGPPTSSTTVTPGPGGASSAPASGICATKGGPDTNFSKPNGYWGSTCDGKLINETDPKAAKPGRKYADRYKCINGVDDVLVPSADTSCDHIPWLDSSPAGPVCHSGAGANAPVVDCAKVHGSNFSCTFDYTSTGTNATATTCCQDGKRYCSVAGTCVGAAQGCPGLQSGIGQTCGADNQCEDFSIGARCLTFGTSGQKTCQWPGGKPPSPTAGPSGNCVSGQKGIGCECSTIPGVANDCNSNNVCKGSWEYGTSNKSYCVPFSTNDRWCEKSQQLLSSAAACTGSPVYTTPTPIPTESPRCPNDGKHLCVASSGPSACVAGYGPSNDPVANDACFNWNQDTPLCYVKGGTPVPACAATPSPVVTTPGVTITTPPKPSPAASGCPIDNGDGRVNSCQESCGGSYPNARSVGNADCTAAYGTIRGACCTSN